MGIPGFYGRWITNNAKKSIITRETFNKNESNYVFSLSVDANSLLHEAAAECYGYTSDEIYNDKRKKEINDKSDDQLIEELVKMIKKKILELIISYFKPSHLFIFAVDGVVPHAKIIQQRQRRYKSSLQTKNSRFDSNSLTPGTKIMEIIDINLVSFFKNIKPKLEKMGFKSLTLIYSSYREKGEGEHKIMNIYRSQMFKTMRENIPLYKDKRPINIIHGLDGDLLILSLISQARDIYLYRSNIDTLVNIEVIKDVIQYKLGNNNNYNRESTVYDFCILMTFIGNDFLPSHPAFENAGIALDNIINIYKNLRSIDKPIVTQNRIINRNKLFSFLYNLSSVEEDFLKKQLNRELILVEDIKKSMAENADIELEKKEMKILPTPAYTLLDSVRKNYITGQNEFDFSLYKNSWNNKILDWKGIYSMVKVNNVIDVEKTYNSIENVCQNYIDMFYWIFDYYFKGDSMIRWDTCYNYYYCPLFRDLSDFAFHCGKYKDCKTVILEDENFEFTCLHQLLSVLPIKSHYLIPDKISKGVNKSPIADLFPDSFDIDYEGKTEHKGVAILPFPDRRRINEYLESKNYSSDFELRKIIRQSKMLIV